MSQPARESRTTVARWRRVSLRAQGVAVLAFPMAVLFAALFSIYWAEVEVRNAEQIVSRSYDTRSEIMALHSSLLDAEAARGGYRATALQGFLAAYQNARAAIGASLARLPSMVGNTPAAVEPLRRVQSTAGAELQLLEELPASLDRESKTMAAIQADLSLLSQEEERIFTGARYVRDLARQRLFRTVIACGILGPLGALFIHLLVAGRLVRRIELVEENARRLAHGLPLEPFPSGSDEIASLARQLEDAAVLLRAREGELQESERRYRDLFDQAPIPYEETDREGNVRRFNLAVCALLQSTPDQILGRSAWDFVSPDQQEVVRADIMERMATGVEGGPFECDYMLEGGTRISVEVRETLTRNAQGEVTGVCRSLLDVTERNLAAMAARKVEQYAIELRNKNEQLARALAAARGATEAKSRFLASVSHELRTPLNGIIGFSELMHDGRLGPVSEDQLDVLGDILTSARHLLQLINDILDLSKVEAGKMTFRPVSCNLDKLVYEVRDVVRPLAAKKNLNLSVDVPADLVAEIDMSRFKQVLYNYLSNAVKFTPQDGAVALRVIRQDDAFFKVEVQDTGIGISPHEVDRLFQEFQQLPNSRKAEQGTGLGLALTRHIVEAQGGSVAVSSEPGRGSVFSAVLPLNTAAGPRNGDEA
jgi:PAS domain S-box-containing protein